MFVKLVQKVRSYIDAQKARDTLSSLDDRMLADIGIGRSDIEFVVRTNDPTKSSLYV